MRNGQCEQSQVTEWIGASTRPAFATPVLAAQMEVMQANLNAVWMHLRREQPHEGLSLARIAYGRAVRDLLDPPEWKGESRNA